MKKKEIIFISRPFAPINVAATPRINKMVHSLTDMGFQVNVFTLDPKEVSPTICDQKLNNEIPKKIKIHYVKHQMKWMVPSIFSKVNKNSKKFNTKKSGQSKKIKKWLAENLIFDTGFGWYFPLLKAVKAFCKNHDVKYVFISGPPFFTFLVPYQIKKIFNIPYILDYRDLFKHHVSYKRKGLSKWITRFIEGLVNKHATHIFTVSDACLLDLLNTKKEKSTVLYNFWESKEYKKYKDISIQNKVPKSKRISLLFSGTYYQGSGFECVCRAIERLDSETQSYLDIQYCGINFSALEIIFNQYLLKCKLINLGYFKKSELIKVLSSADILLSLIHGDSVCSNDLSIKGKMSSKIFEYLGYNAPILNICPKDHELLTLFRQSKIDGVCTFQGDQTNGIKEFISNAIKYGVKKKNRNVSNITWAQQWEEKINCNNIF